MPGRAWRITWCYRASGFDVQGSKAKRSCVARDVAKMAATCAGRRCLGDAIRARTRRVLVHVGASVLVGCQRHGAPERCDGNPRRYLRVARYAEENPATRARPAI